MISKEVDAVGAASAPPQAVPSSANDGDPLQPACVANPCIEEPDATEIARPDLREAGESDLPGPPDPFAQPPITKSIALVSWICGLASSDAACALRLKPTMAGWLPIGTEKACPGVVVSVNAVALSSSVP